MGVSHHTPLMRLRLFSVLVLVVVVVDRVSSIRPYVTCVGCETFLQCFLTCPVADYPGVNKFGVYIPKFLRDIGNSFDSSLRRSYDGSDSNTYKNWKAYNPELYKNYYQRLRRRKRRSVYGLSRESFTD